MKKLRRRTSGSTVPVGADLSGALAGKIGLRKYLHGRKVPEISTPICQCGQPPQSVTHVLAHYQKFHQIRHET